MIPVCSLRTTDKKYGTIYHIGNGCYIVDTQDTTGASGIPVISLSTTDEDVDEPLRKLSSLPYIIIDEKTLILGDKMYRCFGDLPTACQYKVLPMVDMSKKVDYEKKSEYDTEFIRMGYAKELKDAVAIVCPVDMPEDMLMADLLIRERNGRQVTAYSGRTARLPSDATEDGRYILVDKMPSMTGTATDCPHSYTLDTLCHQYEVLQGRLHDYADQRVASLCASMASLPDRILEVTNPYEAASLYRDVTSLLERVRKMS